jgi:hypothetical protein
VSWRKPTKRRHSVSEIAPGSTTVLATPTGMPRRRGVAGSRDAWSSVATAAVTDAGLSPASAAMCRIWSSVNPPSVRATADESTSTASARMRRTSSSE